MFEKTVSYTNMQEVYVPLLNEGVRVPRPAWAVLCGGMWFRLVQPEDYDPDDERWEFLPGSMVECRSENVSGQEILVAVAELSEAKK